MTKKIFKAGPFDLPKSPESQPDYARLVAGALRNLPQLPDFSDDSRIMVMSDFGGEHKGARFNTYTFLIFAQNKIGPFEVAMTNLRRHFGIHEPYSEFSYKRLASAPRRHALPTYLELVDHLIHGVLITLAIDKDIQTMFGPTRKRALPEIQRQLAAAGLGHWALPTGEKALRVCYALSIFLSVLTHSGQRIFWYCDNDPIFQGGNGERPSALGRLFGHFMSAYCPHEFDLVGFGSSFEDKTNLDDLLSITDLAAGISQELLTSNLTGAPLPKAPEKELLSKWLSSPAEHLSKVILDIGRTPDGQIGAGRTDLVWSED